MTSLCVSPSAVRALTPLGQSRTLHETGLKHKGNLERYIRDVYKQAEVGKREAAVEAREIARMNAVSRPRCSTTDRADE